MQAVNGSTFSHSFNSAWFYWPISVQYKKPELSIMFVAWVISRRKYILFQKRGYTFSAHSIVIISQYTITLCTHSSSPLATPMQGRRQGVLATQVLFSSVSSPMWKLRGGLGLISKLQLKQSFLLSFLPTQFLFFLPYKIQCEGWGAWHGPTVPDHDGGRPRQINAWFLYTHMVYS